MQSLNDTELSKKQKEVDEKIIILFIYIAFPIAILLALIDLGNWEQLIRGITLIPVIILIIRLWVRNVS